MMEEERNFMALVGSVVIACSVPLWIVYSIGGLPLIVPVSVNVFALFLLGPSIIMLFKSIVRVYVMTIKGEE